MRRSVPSVFVPSEGLQWPLPRAPSNLCLEDAAERRAQPQRARRFGFWRSFSHGWTWVSVTMGNEAVSSRIALRARQPQVPWAAALGLFQAVDWSGCPRLSPGARSRGPALAFPGRVRFIVNIYTLLKMLYMRATLVWKPPGNTTCALQYSWTGTSLSGRALVLLFECFGGSVSHLLWNCRLSQGKNKRRPSVLSARRSPESTSAPCCPAERKGPYAP